MSNRKHISKIFTVTAVCCLGLVVVLAAGCEKKAEKPAPSEVPSATAQGQPEQQTVDFVNNLCPIMGSKMDLAKVPEKFTRTYKGKKVAFCCASCPAAWDKLSDTEKDTKLSKVLSKKSD